MYTSDALAHFNGDVQKVAAAAGVTDRAVRMWKELVPPLSAAKLQKATKGRLKFDPDLYDNWNNRRAS